MDGGEAGVEQLQFYTNPMAEAEGWLTGAVKDKRLSLGSAATGSIEFEHANPALDESGATTAAKLPQSQMMQSRIL